MERESQIVRTDVVDGLVDNLIDTFTASSEVMSATANEMVSAIFTMALRVTQGAVELGGNKQNIQSALQRIMLECVDTERPN